jgi:mannose-6-phosphate isomerase-like protein (cupin superfamily)
MDQTMSDQLAPLLTSEDDWRREMDRLSAGSGPKFFHMRARLPVLGRTNQMLAASSHMSAVLKTYASGGENELHAHSHEDHLFVILQGAAVFHGPQGETRRVVRNDCVLLPAGTLYKFHAEEDEPLVMLRVGAWTDPSHDVLARVDDEGQPFGGYTEKNKEGPLELHPTAVFE